MILMDIVIKIHKEPLTGKHFDKEHVTKIDRGIILYPKEQL